MTETEYIYQEKEEKDFLTLSIVLIQLKGSRNMLTIAKKD